MRSCYICGRTDWIERHHIFGAANRKKSEEHGFVVDLCHWCHNEPPDGAHHNRERSNQLKRMAQSKYEETHTRAEFMELIGRNYLD